MYLKGPMSKSLSDESVDSPKLEKKVTEDVLARKLEERAEAVKLQFFKISQTIVDLRCNNIWHKDLKMENILLMEPGPTCMFFPNVAPRHENMQLEDNNSEYFILAKHENNFNLSQVWNDSRILAYLSSYIIGF